jgi:putative DNA primase/helicase
MSLTFEQALRLSGLFPKSIVPDGKWKRCPTEDHPHKRNGAYVLHADGRGYWRNWAVDDGVNSWKDDNTTQAKPIDKARIQAQRDRERQYRVQAIKSAREFWNRANPLSLHHPYLKEKGLTPVGCFGLRTLDGLLVIPVLLGGSLISVQTIAPDGTKRFWPGAPVKSGSYVIKRERAPVTIFCEGLATGLALYQSIRSASVVVCFDAGNLLPVIEFMKPSGSVVIGADNDWRTKLKRGTNPGIEKATNAAELIGAGVAYPQGIEGSDWADALRDWGQGGAKRMEREVLAKAKFVT